MLRQERVSRGLQVQNLQLLQDPGEDVHKAAGAQIGRGGIGKTWH